jgi:hypothetical protein
MRRRTRGQVMTVIIGLIGLSLGFVTAAVTGQTRYVIASKNAGIEFKQYPLWTSKLFADKCAEAIRYGMKDREETWCKTGVDGLKPAVGVLTVGTVVVLLDSPQCGQMAYIRVLTGNFKSETGCITASALSSVQP